ncbi:MAG: hypothetical protein A3G49_01745 [Candidatus Sungbacteria bacterium RIFCSPLOWO2_12_FULL_41_11]|uniref:Uncharacterized protein n=1 Tax=Candidatus Sungbacteria bacterium RIFCSPLOWO2_12_FULL_41_11 TaxID=1802286 RepID=A0A1G2LQU5_9BACT|nr:MAG: hypothetical protein A3D41_01595 [Candidatus Sungbacteria bacterium RIFCSPHIGHO2_02_FULL_41_12b]OHA13943.1 MAG: hypothetical protein A3G49_01745 [Candidatus Sungbacteria bacterium RIFCSPLOWO2_12_FULL_41_11]
MKKGAKNIIKYSLISLGVSFLITLSLVGYVFLQHQEVNIAFIHIPRTIGIWLPLSAIFFWQRFKNKLKT